jgi:outer membrane protein TolC
LLTPIAVEVPPSLPAPPPETLSVENLVQQVLARNPSLAQMVAAWEAASARYPQVTSLDDPMFDATLGPATYGSNTVNPAYRLEVAQKLPFPGKLRLRGQNAQAEAHAASNEVEDMRLQLVESASHAFFEYCLAVRLLEVNHEGLLLLQNFRKTAATRFQTGQVPQQDVLLADVEIGKQRERALTLERMRRVAIARINTLLNQEPDLPLLPPPALTVAGTVSDPGQLRALALAQRPDLQAVANRIAAEEAALALAHKECYPDVEPYFMYDRFMGNTADSRDLAYMLGVRLNLPVRTARRNAQVAEALAKLHQRRAELARLTDQVNFQVQEAYEQVRESRDIANLYQDKILPDAKLNVEAAQSAYVTGKVAFLGLIEAQRNQVMLRERHVEAVADYCRRRATLERVIGGPLDERLTAQQN